MSFISYAQNYEDVILWRALKHVQHGFYIDVGANDPTVDSVTKAFYDRGWRGINVEPIKQHHQDLVEVRPNDINLLCAAGPTHGQIDIWECDVRGWATTAGNVIQKHEQDGHAGVLHKVPLFPLGDICEQYVQGEIHFLKIDVEGFEEEVLKGMNFKKYRPWIVVIEATKPNSTEEIHKNWEALIISNDYIFAYADGLNRFYVSKEQTPNLFDVLRYPPNVFDGYIRVQQYDSEIRAQKADAKAQQAQELAVLAEAKAQQAREQTMQAEAKAQQAQEQAMQAEVKAQQAQEQAMQAEAKAQQAQEQTMQAEVKAQQAQEQTMQAEAKAQQAQEQAMQAEVKAQQAQEQAMQAEAKAQQAQEQTMQAEVKVQQAEATSKLLVAQLHAVHNSRSLRITKPLRFIGRILKGETSSTASFEKYVRSFVRPVIVMAVQTAASFPALKRHVSPLLLRQFPIVHARLRRLIKSSTNIDSIFFSLPAGSTRDGPYRGKKVAVLAPASSSGVVGGAERFYSGLVTSLSNVGCEAQLVLLTVDESNFESIQKGYRDFTSLDLTKYDLVISTKAPSYAVNHTNHVLYLVHTVRVFYDMFEYAFPNANDILKSQQEWIHKQDTAAFKNIQHRFAIGKEVSDRLEIWNDSSAEILHPPLDLDGLYDSGIGDYFYMPGRLHEWKRVDLAIRAVKASSLPMRLLISGIGDAEPELRALAGNDQRIDFLGRVSDEELKRLYAGALAVPFLPIREDYGYVTLEAFASGKPVITCVDSGEPTVFVEEGISGFVCEPNAESVKSAMERLWRDRNLAAKMGIAGKERITEISWEAVASRLLGAGFPSVQATQKVKRKLKVAVLDMQPILPAVGGGRLRLLGLYHALGDDVHARYVGTYDWPGESYRRQSITPALEEILVPLSAEHHTAARNAAAKAGGKTVIDMLFPQQAHLSPEYLREIHSAVQWADVVVFSHPWVSPLVNDELLIGKTVIYDSQNVEQTLRSQILDANSLFERDVLNEVTKAERHVGDRADLILACSKEDIDGFVDLYGWPRNKIRVFPNGVFSNVILPAKALQKLEARRELGIGEADVVGFFIGSDYAPNVEAGNFIIEHLAPTLPKVTFSIGGGVCSKLSSKIPTNVRSIGFLEEREKLLWLQASDFGVNPMFSGSGTNIKMFDLMSAGLPIVTTPVGARGIEKVGTSGLRIAGRLEFAASIKQLLNNKHEIEVGGRTNREAVLERFAWETISPGLGRAIRSVYLRKRGRALLADQTTTSKMKVAHLSTVGLKCGIGEYTRKIIGVYKQQGIQNLLLTAYAADEISNLGDLNFPVEIGWYFDNKEWQHSKIYPKSLATMQEWGATHLIIQYHPGFFSSKKLLDFAKQTVNSGIDVTVVLHNYTSDSTDDLRALWKFGVTLFSHRMTEVTEAGSHHLLLDHIPLAIDSNNIFFAKSITKRDWDENPLQLVTTGFLRKHKGVHTLIRAMPAILKIYPKAMLNIQCSIYPSEDSRLELESCQREIEHLNLKSNVVMNNSFLDKEDLVKGLSKADIAILPYEESNEGGSATAADCMAAGLPLIVSTAEIFDELRDTALTTEPTVEGIVQGLMQILSNDATYAAYSNKSFTLTNENSTNNVLGALLIHIK